jgi:hypothetical protein
MSIPGLTCARPQQATRAIGKSKGGSVPATPRSFGAEECSAKSQNSEDVLVSPLGLEPRTP